MTLKVELYDSDSLEPISGARVEISAENLTQTLVTDTSGSVIFDVNATTLYSINITAPDYLSREGSIDVGTADVDAQYWLLPSNRFSFIIKDKDGLTPVHDAEVRVDTILAGKTDARGVLTIPVTRGTLHTIDIEKPGYQTYNQTKLIGETDAIDSVALIKTLYTAFIFTLDEDHNPINGTELYVNGTFEGTTDQFGRGNFSGLVSGPYLIEVRKTGYITLNQTILVANPGEEFTFEMPTGTTDLTIFVEDKDQKLLANATILMNNNTAGITDDHGQFSTKVKFNTLYNISVVKDSYQTVSIQKKFLQGNNTQSVSIIMEKSQDWGFVTLIVIGAVAILVLFGIFRMFSGRKRRHIMRKNDI